MRFGRSGIPDSLECLGEFRHGVVGGYGLVDRPMLRGASLYDVKAYLLQAMIFELQNLRGTVGKVNNSALHDRSAVIHFDHYGPSVAQVGDLHIASQRKRRMGGRHVVHVEVFAAGGLPAVEVLAIPRGCPNLIRLMFGGLVT